jgi:hypothetical protein
LKGLTTAVEQKARRQDVANSWQDRVSLHGVSGCLFVRSARRESRNQRLKVSK